MDLKKAFFILICGCFQGFGSVCYFVPPENWRCANPTKLSKHVNIGFIGKGSSSSFNPSINLAQEKTPATLDEYVKAIKSSYATERKTSIRELGKIKNNIEGETSLLEISKQSPFGEIKLLQSITKKDDEIYVLTGAVLKEELLKFKEDFLNAFKSLKITDNLLRETSNQEEVADLEDKFSALKEKKLSIKDFEKHIEENYQLLGNYWKILVLKDAYESIQK